MSDFVPHDILPDLWDEILRRHWTFLETEESIQKLEERKKLEGCLKEFLCIVPHDRKFFLPETAHVLRKSLREMDDFTAYKAIVGFESISQYANNLFTKPWRKEFRVLKMYSGFFQHEIKSNLIDAEKLFEAMGYRRLSDELLVLDGPICPDQVTNVSRDAMAAYVECQIIKHIYAGLVALGLTCTWQDVYHYREKYIGGTTQAIKGLAYAIQERRHRKEKQINNENCYATIEHSQNAMQCPNCSPYNVALAAHQHQPNGPCALHSNSSSCVLHPQGNQIYNNSMNGKLLASYPTPANYQYAAQQQQQQPHMSHSRSLDHYNEPHALLPHRHSFDHQQQGCTAAHHYQRPQTQPHLYESPYDCLDGVSMGSSASYAAVAGAAGNCNMNGAYAHPYNVSGNRVPLPYNISNQLNSHYATPQVSCNGMKGIAPDAYGNLDNGYAVVTKPQHSCNHHTQAPLPPTRHGSAAAYVNAAKDFQTYRQRSFPPDQLIDFDDRAPLTSHDFHAQMHHALTHNNSLDYERGERMHDQRRERHAANRAAAEDYVYARPLPRSAKASHTTLTDKYLRNTEMGQVLSAHDYADNKRSSKMPNELKERAGQPLNGSRRKPSARAEVERDTSEVSYESAFDDFVTVGHSERPQRSPTQASKNQDGVGSFESWDYVFRNLERTGYSKDLGERGDVLVQSLDLNPMTLGNAGGSSADKRNSKAETKTSSGRQALNGGGAVEKARANDKPSSATATKNDNKVGNKFEKSILKQPSMANGGAIRKTTSAAASAAAAAAAATTATKSALKTTATTNAITDNNNGNAILNGNNNSTTKTTAAATNSVANTRRRNNSNGAAACSSSNTKQRAPIATQVIVSSPNEWSCRFCTFLNPDTKRICEMCCRSKDFNLEATVSNAPTCV